MQGPQDNSNLISETLVEGSLGGVERGTRFRGAPFFFDVESKTFATFWQES